MDQIVLASVPRLNYLCDPLAIEAVLETNSEGDFDPDPLTGGRCLADHDHLVLATDARTDRVIAALGADEGKTNGDSFVTLVTWRCESEGAVRGPRLLRRMAAMMLLRIAGLHAAPRAVAAPADQPALLAALVELGARLQGAVLFPGLNETVIPLQAAAFARRIARGLGREWGAAEAQGHGARGQGSMDGGLALRSELPVRRPNDIAWRNIPLPAVLDLRAIPEPVLLEDARRLYRQR